MVGTVRGYFNDLFAQPPHQRRVFAIGSTTMMRSCVVRNTLISSRLGGEALAGAGGAEVQPVGRLQLFLSAMMTLWERAFMP